MSIFIPMKHQLSAMYKLKNMDQKGNGGFLADSMGMGKTVTMSMYMVSNKIYDRPDLIVCPFSLLSIWKKWILRVQNWNNDYRKINVIIYHGRKRNRIYNKLNNYDFVITTYSIIGTGELNYKKWNRVVLDESHYIKNGLKKNGPKCAKAAYKIAINSYSRFCVSGTPFNNRVKDIVSQAFFIGTEPYNNPEWWVKNWNNEKSIREWKSVFVLHRTKEGLLASPSYKDINLEPHEYEKNIILYLRQKAHDKFKKWKKARQIGDNIERIKMQGEILALIQKLRIISNSNFSGMGVVDVDEVMEKNNKVQSIINNLDNALYSDPKNGVVIFSQFTSFLDVIEQVIEVVLPGVEVLKFYGNMNMKERNETINYFNEKRHLRVILISIMAGGVGLSLHHGSSTVFLTEPYYNPFVERQAEERVHRIGQEYKVNIYRYHMNNSVENWVNALKKKKLTIAGQLDFVNKDHIPIDFNFDDIEELFKEHVSFILPNDITSVK